MLWKSRRKICQPGAEVLKKWKTQVHWFHALGTDISTTPSQDSLIICWENFFIPLGPTKYVITSCHVGQLLSGVIVREHEAWWLWPQGSSDMGPSKIRKQTLVPPISSMIVPITIVTKSESQVFLFLQVICICVKEKSSRSLLMDFPQFCNYFSGQLNLFFFD